MKKQARAQKKSGIELKIHSGLLFAEATNFFAKINRLRKEAFEERGFRGGGVVAAGLREFLQLLLLLGV